MYNPLSFTLPIDPWYCILWTPSHCIWYL